MRALCFVALYVGLGICFSDGQQTDQVRLGSLPELKAVPLQKPSETNEIVSYGALDKVGGSDSAPVPLYLPEPEYSDEARRAKYQGVALVSMIVDAHGIPQNVRIVKPLGYGLSEKAIEAVMKYRFKPAMKDGKPVPVRVNIEVYFRLYTR